MKGLLNKRLLQHIAFWAFYSVIYTLNYTFAPNVKNRTIGETFLFLPGHLIFTYCQMYLLVPRYLLRKKYLLYFLTSLAVLVVALLYARWVSYYFLGWHRYVTDWFQFYVVAYSRAAFSYLPVAGLAVSIKLYRTWMHERERAQKAEHEKVKMELEMLRSQLHPHFLFNTLNNLYSLTLTASATASTVVLHLSALLRYILYECTDASVPLDKELSMLKKYVELEKLRYGNRIDVAFTISGDTRQLVIAPLILLPFIENSFKHSATTELDLCWINIHVNLHEQELAFHVMNSRSESNHQATGGIGLQNVKKRLALLYPGKFDLKISEEDEVYNLKVQLTLEKIAQQSQVPAEIKHPQTITNEIPLPAGR
jgi:two-component system, LytTR family, sensor kinase